MKVTKTEIEGLLVIDLEIRSDPRGFFVERFHAEKFASLGLPTGFVQDNFSRSLPQVLRGLHFQGNPNQGKLVTVTRGKIYDVAVDLRRNSKTYGRYFGTELSDEVGRHLWIPGGFAHGFCVFGNEPADVLYKVDCFYNAQHEGGVRWNDPELKISWPIQNPIVSERDQKLPLLGELKPSL